MFSFEVINRLNFYVYRLIDPRNGQTFYVGKGTGNRVFSHVKGEEGNDSDELSDKLKRIREIKNDGFEVGQIWHDRSRPKMDKCQIKYKLLQDKMVYVYCPNGYGRTKIHNNYFERKLKVRATTQNHKTVTTLLEKLTNSKWVRQQRQSTRGSPMPLKQVADDNLEAIATQNIDQSLNSLNAGFIVGGLQIDIER